MQDLMDKGANEETLQEIRSVLDNISELSGYHDLKHVSRVIFY